MEKNADIYECVFFEECDVWSPIFVVILDFLEVLEALQVIGTYGFLKVRAKPYSRKDVQKDNVQSTKVESGEKFLAQGHDLKVWEVGVKTREQETRDRNW